MSQAIPAPSAQHSVVDNSLFGSLERGLPVRSPINLSTVYSFFNVTAKPRHLHLKKGKGERIWVWLLEPNCVQELRMVGEGCKSISSDKPTGSHCWNPNSRERRISTAVEAVNGSGWHWKHALPSSDGRTVCATFPPQISLMREWCTYKFHFTFLPCKSRSKCFLHSSP